MGRPWWYDEYWDRQKGGRRPSRRRGPQLPRGRGLAWVILLAAVALLTLLRTVW
jgi:hypothetical protein